MGANVYFHELFEANYVKLCQVANRIVKDQDEARDIVQQAFLSFWERATLWHEIQSHEAYLYTSVYYSSLAFLKKGKTFTLGNQDALTFSSNGTPLEELSLIELESAVMKAVTKLPTKCREIFLLSREEELSYRQISEKLNISVKTVEAQMGIALKRLREDLAPEIPDKIFFLLFF